MFIFLKSRSAEKIGADKVGRERTEAVAETKNDACERSRSSEVALLSSQ